MDWGNQLPPKVLGSPILSERNIFKADSDKYIP